MTDYEIGGSGGGGGGGSVLVGGANITLSTAGSTVTIIGGAGGAGFTAGVSTFGNTAGTTGTQATQLILVGSNNITLSQSSAAGGATVSILGVASQTIQTQNRFNLTISGNTAGVLAAVSSGTLTLVGGNNITLSQAGNVITISGPSDNSQSIGMSNLGHTAGTSGIAFGEPIQFLFDGGNNITLSQSLNGASGTITINGPDTFSQTVQTQNLIAATLAGNTAGALALVSSGTLTLAGGANITLSQAGNAVTISGAAGGTGGAAAPDMVWWENGVMGQSTLTIQFHSSNFSNPIFFPLGRHPLGGNMTISTMGMRFTGNVTGSGNSSSHTISLAFGLYTLNGQTLSLLNSVLTTLALGATADNSASYFGPRLLTVHSSQWSAQPVVSAGVMYWWCLSYAVANLMPGSFSYSALRFGDIAQFFGTVGVSAATATTMGPRPFMGQYSASTAALPTAVQNSELNKAAVAAFHAPPHIFFNNLAGGF